MDCIFCKIARKEIKAYIIYEDEAIISFLDVNPRSKGMALVTSKTHLVSLEDNLEISKKMFEVSIKIAKVIKKTLSPLAIGIAYFPSKIEHIHLRIYPYYENEIPLIENKPKETNDEELQKIADLIRKSMEETLSEKLEKPKIEKKEEIPVIQKTEEKIEEVGEKEISRRKRDWLIA